MEKRVGPLPIAILRYREQRLWGLLICEKSSSAARAVLPPDVSKINHRWRCLPVKGDNQRRASELQAVSPKGAVFPTSSIDNRVIPFFTRSLL